MIQLTRMAPSQALQEQVKALDSVVDELGALAARPLINRFDGFWAEVAPTIEETSTWSGVLFTGDYPYGQGDLRHLLPSGHHLFFVDEGNAIPPELLGSNLEMVVVGRERSHEK